MESLGEYIKTCRIARGMSQTELGMKCGYTKDTAFKTVQSWEHDRQLVPLKRLRALAKALKVPVETLVP